MRGVCQPGNTLRRVVGRTPDRTRHTHWHPRRLLMRRVIAATAALLVFLTLSRPIMAREAPLFEKLDAIAAEVFAKDGPGGAVIVVKDGKTLLRKGYGM